jgi:hypothetical protein
MTPRLAARSAFIGLLVAAATHVGLLHAAARVVVGPTAIIDGEALAPGDITVSNAKLAFAIAIETSVPYGVPRGAIIDVAPAIDGKPGRDRVVFADFIPNNWSAWPNTYQKAEIVDRGPDQVVVQATRDWGNATITTTYRLEANADRIEMRTTMANTGDAALTGLLSGQTLWPSAGYFFGIPGLGDLQEGQSAGALSDRVVAYDADWTVALHAPYLDYVGSRSKDLFLQHALQPGESRTFDAWLQVGSRGDLAPVLAAEIERNQFASGKVHGTVSARDGKTVDEPVIVVSKQGVPYAWTLGRGGRYDVTLPAGDYEFRATGKGYSQSKPAAVRVGVGTDAALDFRGIEPPGTVEFDVVEARTGRKLDARIGITEGQQQSVEFLGRSTLFTELDDKGRLRAEVAPGSYSFRVSSGGGFVGPGQDVKLAVQPGRTTQAQVTLTRLFNPAASGWYSADLHHHADQAEGVTPPEYVARSQLAAGLDLLFVSDHDSTANHAPLQQIADRRGMPFIPSLELSPSWGHFNAWPLQPGQKLAIDTSTATIDEVLGEARRQGAIVVQSNHPFIPYGYLASLKAGVVPGGFNPAFDLVEINSDVPFDAEVLRALWQFWNAGHRYYLSGGTDVHDVWNHESGRLRTFAHIEGKPTPGAFAAAVKAGHAYVSYGPLLEPSVMFGSDLKVPPDARFVLPFKLKSVAGLKQARLISAGSVVATKVFDIAPQQASVEFSLTATRSTWFSIEVEDRTGNKAYSNPIWIDVVDYPTPATAR